MMAQGETLGLLHLNFEDPRDLTPGRRRLAETASKQIAVALANLQLRESLQDLSFSDPLTGLYNRRYLEISLTRELHRLDREGGSLGLIVLDLDHFKRINDDFGHETGDKVLKAIGTYLKANTRQSDIAFRYGGEEFILALVDSPFTSTCERAETLRRGMRELDLSWERPELSFLTASFGVASFPEHGTTFDELFRVADEGVYLAKQSGRDRVGRAA
jgi:diguanylate cyclase (GGDEF)-like protein